MTWIPISLVWNKRYKTLFLLKKCSAAAGFAVSVMRQMHPAQDTELSSMKWQEGCFTASKPTCTRMAIREHCAAASSAPIVLEECRWNRVKHKGHRGKEKPAKTHWRTNQDTEGKKVLPTLRSSQFKAEEQLAGFCKKAAVEFVKAVSVSTSD